MLKLKDFEPYVAELEELAVQSIAAATEIDKNERIMAALNGGTSAALRRMIPVLERRKIGAFFTSSELAKEAFDFFDSPIDDSSVFADFACGGGDLLMAIARVLPIDEDLGLTLSKWGERLIGFDLQPEFIRATKARLVLTAIDRGAKIGETPIPTGEDLFPLIRQGDGLTQNQAFNTVTHILINPSFSKVIVPRGCSWASEKVSSAAVFLDACVTNAEPGTTIVAILPDVLRSGSNYKKWREYIISKASVENIRVIGQFDEWADVDVFMIRLCVGSGTGRFNSHEWWECEGTKNGPVVEDLFDVHVGRVVPYRDPKRGPSYPYIYAKLLTPWATVREFQERRKFSGPVSKPPFVVVRRTSRPGHEYRAVGTIICSSEKVAVENHLIVLQPRDGLVRTCRELLGVLRTPRTNDWLDERIRCRHLTVSSIRELPW
jgi:hypothetical protein